MSYVFYRVFPVHNGLPCFGVFDPSGDYLFKVFSTRAEAEKYANRMNLEVFIHENSDDRKKQD